MSPLTKEQTWLTGKTGNNQGHKWNEPPSLFTTDFKSSQVEEEETFNGLLKVMAVQKLNIKSAHMQSVYKKGWDTKTKTPNLFKILQLKNAKDTVDRAQFITH